MFEKIGRLAETAATHVGVSRRGFLGGLGQFALGVAGILAGVTAARAQSGGVVCCYYYRGPYPKSRKTVCQKAGMTCANSINGGKYGNYFLTGSSTAASCQDCLIL
jgi:hypothetical protein